MPEWQQNIATPCQQQPIPQPKVSEMMTSVAATFSAMGQAVYAQEQQYENRISTLQQAIPSYTNIVADQKRKELIAIINATYESGLVDREKITKTEFFRRQAAAYGDPQLADYARQLSQIMLSNKYEDVFSQVSEAGINYRTNKEK